MSSVAVAIQALNRSDAAASAGRDGHSYGIRLSVLGCHFARGPSGRAVLLIPMASGAPAPGRLCGRLALSFVARMDFRVGPTAWQGAAAVIECMDEGLLSTFCALGMDLANGLRPDRALPTTQSVSTALATWEALLRTGRHLSESAELGLFGELWLISRSTDPDRAIDGWQGPSGSATDFFGAQVALECKTSGSRLQHEVSHRQLVRPRGDQPAFLMSIWAEQDQVSGRSLPELIGSIDARIARREDFEKKLLRTGYSRVDAGIYTRRLLVVERPSVFPVDCVPRVRAWDEGVASIHYTIRLDESTALDDEATTAVLSAFCVELPGPSPSAAPP